MPSIGLFPSKGESLVTGAVGFVIKCFCRRKLTSFIVRVAAGNVHIGNALVRSQALNRELEIRTVLASCLGHFRHLGILSDAPIVGKLGISANRPSAPIHEPRNSWRGVVA